MPCNHVTLPGGAYAIICTKGQRAKPCKYCGRPHEKLCDYKLTGARAGKTCDIPMCAKCAFHVPPDEDFCPAHRDIILKAIDGNL